MAQLECIVGIDLGTTNSEVAAIIDGKPVIVRDGPDDDGIMPSVVGLDDQGNVIVGRTARNQMLLAPGRTVASIKRATGTDTKVSFGHEQLSPTQISAFILRTLKKRAEKILGRRVTGAVLTVPAYFTDAQRQATRAAGALADLKVARIINEPTAAALSYGGTHTEGGTVLVYDLGGGTFDVSVVRMQRGIVEVLATAGNNHLGGDDFDALIARKLLEGLEQTEQMTIDRKDQVLQARLLRAAETAKIELSQRPFASVLVDRIAEKSGNPVHLQRELSRSELIDWLTPLLNQTMEHVSRARTDAEVKPSELDRVILVGGSSRMPVIRKLLRERLMHEPHGEIDPDLCVALGAAVQAGMEMGHPVDSILVYITPYTFGTSVVGQLYGQPYAHEFMPMIRRNAPLPAQASEVVYKQFDDQDKVEIQVYQGEDPDALKNTRIGRFFFDDLRCEDGDRKLGFLFTYQLDLDGILEVIAIERATQRRLVGRVERAMSDADTRPEYLKEQMMTFSSNDDTDLLDDFADDADLLDNGRSDSSPQAAANSVSTTSNVHVGSADTNTLAAEIQAAHNKAKTVRASENPTDAAEIDALLVKLGDFSSRNETQNLRAHLQDLDDLLYFIR